MSGLLTFDNGLPGSPSAIQGLLSQMMMAGPESLARPAVPAAPSGPGPTPPFAPPAKKSMGDRVRGLLGMGTPAGYEGVLTPEEISSARPGLLQSIIGTPNAPSPQSRFEHNLNRIVAMKQMAAEAAAQKKLGEVRAGIAQRFAEVPDETPQQTIARLRSMFAAYVAAGDMESAGKVGEVVKSLGNDAAKAVRSPVEVRVGNEVILLDPETREEIRRYPIQAGPKDPNAAAHAKEVSDQRMYTRRQGLADDYNKDTKETRETARNISSALAEAQNAKAGDGMAQVNMLYAFVSAMDPGTAVKEGEVGLVRAGASLRQQAEGLLQKYGQGESVVVPAAMVAQMERLMQRRLTGMQGYVKSRSKYYEKRARDEKVWTDGLFPVLEVMESAPPTAGPPAAPGNAIRDRIGGIKP